LILNNLGKRSSECYPSLRSWTQSCRRI